MSEGPAATSEMFEGPAVTSEMSERPAATSDAGSPEQLQLDLDPTRSCPPPHAGSPDAMRSLSAKAWGRAVE